jgi:hypothetical protein
MTVRHIAARLCFAAGAAAVLVGGASAQTPATPAPGAPAAAGPLQGSFNTPAAGCAPVQLFKATVRNVSPGLAAADRAAQPRQLWRLGDTFLRSEESPDPVRGDLAVIIVAEPDIWVYNPATRQGRHSVDPGPELKVKAPVLPPTPDLPAAFRSLEYGCEPAFVAAYAPQPQRIVPWGGSQAALHTVTMGDHTVAVLMDVRRNTPLMLSYLRGGQPVMVMRYDEYRNDLPNRPTLFQPPKNIRITEAGRQAPPSPLSPSP